MWGWIGGGILLAYLTMAFYQAWKPLPAGLNAAMPMRSAGELVFLADETYRDGSGRARAEQHIFDEILRIVGQAERLVVLDMFLLNDFAGSAADDSFRPLSSELVEALIQRKRERPSLVATVISDPLNTLYGGLRSPHFDVLREAGVNVIVTDLSQLRASNPIWSGLWHLCCRWLGNTADNGWLPNVLGPGKVTLRSYWALLNFNANHRKTLVADQGDTWVGLVTSANPHDASSRHGNVALRFTGPAALDLLSTERTVAELSGGTIVEPEVIFDGTDVTEASGRAQLQVLTEGRIREALLHVIASSVAGDRLDLAVFYLAHREMIAALEAAQRRGVAIRLLLDPNKDAFGMEKNGIPNRQVAHELHQADIPIRWCDTHGEQCHSKLLLKMAADGSAEMILGSANFTRRNLDNLNLESSLRVLAGQDLPALQDAADYFERNWSNSAGRQASVAYSVFADDSRLRYWQYRLMEATGLSTF